MGKIILFKILVRCSLFNNYEVLIRRSGWCFYWLMVNMIIIDCGIFKRINCIE